jgi:hypothetical protein
MRKFIWIIVFIVIMAISLMFCPTLPSEETAREQIVDQYPECTGKIESIVEDNLRCRSAAGHGFCEYEQINFLICESQQLKIQYNLD